MKKLFKSMFMLAIAALAFTSCEDVPMPYDDPNNNGGGDEPGVTTKTLPYNSTSLNDWTAITPKGIAWSLGSSYAKASGYASEAYTETEAWLVSPVINTTTSTGVIIDFDHVIRYVYNSSDIDNHKMYISKDYDGDVTTATWTELAYEPVASSTNTWDFYAANTIAVPDEYLNTEVVIAFKFVCGSSNSTTWELQNFSIKEGTGGSSVTPGEATGNGTLENPYNSVAANQLASSLASGEESDYIYIKGKISSIKENYDSNSYGNASFYISDDGSSTDEFYVFRALYLNNEKYSSGTLPQVGDDVVVYAKLTNYMGNTPETVQGACYLYSLNGNTSSGGSGTTGEATGDGSLANPYNSVAANNVASALASGEQSDYVYIKGKVSSITENYDNSYGNATFYISDDGTSANQFYVYRVLYLNNEKYASGDLLSVGDDVVVYAKLTNYMGNTPETVQGDGYLYSLTSNGGGGTGGEVSGNSITVTASSFGLANGTEVGTQTLSDGTTLTFESGGNSNAPKYYNAGTNIRMYPKNYVTIKGAKKIASIILNCDEYNSIICNASGEISASPGSVDVNEKVVTIKSINSTQTTITNTNGSTGTASQIRIVSMTINYAE